MSCVQCWCCVGCAENSAIHDIERSETSLQYYCTPGPEKFAEHTISAACAAQRSTDRCEPGEAAWGVTSTHLIAGGNAGVNIGTSEVIPCKHDSLPEHRRWSVALQPRNHLRGAGGATIHEQRQTLTTLLYAYLRRCSTDRAGEARVGNSVATRVRNSACTRPWLEAPPPTLPETLAPLRALPVWVDSKASEPHGNPFAPSTAECATTLTKPRDPHQSPTSAAGWRFHVSVITQRTTWSSLV